MNDKSSPEELIKYRRYTLKMLWGGTGSPHHVGKASPTTATLATWPRCTSTALRGKPRSSWPTHSPTAITGPEEGVLKRRRTDHDHRCIPALCRRKGRKTMFTSIVRRYQAWRRYETVRRELSHLTDRELADIGITRSDIERIASGEAHS